MPAFDTSSADFIANNEYRLAALERQKALDDRAQANLDRSFEYRRDTDDRNFKYRKALDDRAQANLDRSFEYRRDADDRNFEYSKALSDRAQANADRSFAHQQRVYEDNKRRSDRKFAMKQQEYDLAMQEKRMKFNEAQRIANEKNENRVFTQRDTSNNLEEGIYNIKAGSKFNELSQEQQKAVKRYILRNEQSMRDLEKQRQYEIKEAYKKPNYKIEINRINQKYNKLMDDDAAGKDFSDDDIYNAAKNLAYGGVDKHKNARGRFILASRQAKTDGDLKFKIDTIAGKAKKEMGRDASKEEVELLKTHIKRGYTEEQALGAVYGDEYANKMLNKDAIRIWGETYSDLDNEDKQNVMSMRRKMMPQYMRIKSMDKKSAEYRDAVKNFNIAWKTLADFHGVENIYSPLKDEFEEIKRGDYAAERLAELGGGSPGEYREIAKQLSK